MPTPKKSNYRVYSLPKEKEKTVETLYTKYEKQFACKYVTETYCIFAIELKTDTIRREYERYIQEEDVQIQKNEIVPRPRTERGFIRFVMKTIYQKCENGEKANLEIHKIITTDEQRFSKIEKTLPPSQLGIEKEKKNTYTDGKNKEKDSLIEILEKYLEKKKMEEKRIKKERLTPKQLLEAKEEVKLEKTIEIYLMTTKEENWSCSNFFTRLENKENPMMVQNFELSSKASNFATNQKIKQIFNEQLQKYKEK